MSWAHLVLAAWHEGRDHVDGIPITSEVVQEAFAALEPVWTAEERQRLEAFKARHPMETAKAGRPRDEKLHGAIECSKWLVSVGWKRDAAAVQAAERFGANEATVRKRLQGWEHDPDNPPDDKYMPDEAAPF